MASEQERRDSTTKERETHLEAERVPKMTIHFESLSEKVKGGDMARSESTVPPSEEGVGKEGDAQGGKSTGPRTIGKFEMNVGEEKGSAEDGDEEKKTTPSLEEISKFREKAQQNSIEALRAAEERYQKAKELGASKLQEVKESVAPRVESVTTYATERGAQAKDTALEKSQQGYTTAKDTLVTAGKTAADYTKQTAEQAKDYTLQQATQAKDVVVSSGQTAVQYVGEKAVAAKDVSLEKAAELKDKALATGWGATHYTTEKAVEVTKAAAGAVQSAAEHKGEKVMHYTGRKKEEAQQELAAKQSPETKGENGGEETRSAMPAQGKREMSQRGTEHKSIEGVVGVLEAVGETMLEIAQATKELVIGKDQTSAGEKGEYGRSPMESTKAELR